MCFVEQLMKSLTRSLRRGFEGYFANYIIDNREFDTPKADFHQWFDDES